MLGDFPTQLKQNGIKTIADRYFLWVADFLYKVIDPQAMSGKDRPRIQTG